MTSPIDYDGTNDKFIDIILANDWDFPVEVHEDFIAEDIFAGGFMVLPVPQEVIIFWQQLLDTQGDDGNFFNNQ
ncbi:MAG: hypothetical protein Tp1124SUR1244132_17 [Prokaryotic dsDNA virus sp.]|nr:MAG: hypothetical protein Tp1124SUR1244132_17 [Prokaryotic dsDNA virus sp.]|tara:strand:+ start:7248 stop:7469 length:222 start_codon:yes stop_codon:yes gene_type:complete